MQKKIYEVPALEVIETESESIMVNTSPGGTTEFEGGDFGEIGTNTSNDMSNKRQYGFNTAPWE